MFCWHRWNKWSEPFQGVWNENLNHTEFLLGVITDREPRKNVLMSQKRSCKKCGKVQYRKCK